MLFNKTVEEITTQYIAERNKLQNRFITRLQDLRSNVFNNLKRISVVRKEMDKFEADETAKLNKINNALNGVV